MFQTKFNFIIAKTESTAGTAESLTGSDFDWCPVDGTIEYTPTVEMDDENAKCANGEHGETESVPGNQFATINFTYKYRYSGTATTPPKANTKLFPGVGLTETVTAGGVKWEPLLSGDSAVAAVNANSLTIGIYEKERAASPQAKLHLLAGCMGNVVFTCEGVGKPLLLNFTFQGKLISVTDITAGNVPTVGTRDTALPNTFLGDTTSIHGVNLKLSTFTFDLGNDVQPVLNQADSRGIDYYGIAGRVPRFTCDPYTERVATFDWYSKWKNATRGTNTITFNTDELIIKMPSTQILTVGKGSREGLNSDDITFKLLRNGDDPSPDSDIANESTFQLLQKSLT